jgi:hypothetical protein
MRFLPTVNRDNCSPALWSALAVAAILHRDLCGAELVVTSMWRPHDTERSHHSPAAGTLCGAADVRRWTLDAQERAPLFCHELARMFGGRLVVLAEPEDLAEPQRSRIMALPGWAPHVHIQLADAELPKLLEAL